MKRNSTIICTMAALLMAGAALVSCTKESQPISGTFTLSVNASKGNPAMKDLELVGNTLNAKWKDGERVTVYNITRHEDLSGYLYVGNDKGGSYVTKLEGSVSGIIGDGDELELRFLYNPNYGTQDGTLGYIAANCDYALDTVTVTEIDSEHQIVKTQNALFNNKQAIVKFSLKDNSDALITANTLKVEVEGQSAINVTLSPAASDLYVAIPGFSSKNVTFNATVGTDTYTGTTTSSVSLENGKYYTIPVKLTKQN